MDTRRETPNRYLFRYFRTRFFFEGTPPALLSILIHKKSIFEEIKTRALISLLNLLSVPEASHVLLSPSCVDKIPILIQMAKKCVIEVNSDTITRNSYIKFSQNLWNLKTNPVTEIHSKNPMASLLPFFRNNKKLDILPSSFEKGKQQGLIFWGSDRRCVEFRGFSPSSGRRQLSLFANFGTGGRSRANQLTEVLVHGNLPVPNLEYFFEVKIEKSDLIL
jgi:hypothetical protein